MVDKQFLHSAHMPQNLVTRDLSTLAGTEALGRAIACLVVPGDAVLLQGPLGAGKSTLARALIRAACADPALEVPSPTYTLVQRYEAVPAPLHHFDLWRLDGPAALHELGWDDARADIVLVEWPDRLGPEWPDDALVIDLTDRRRAMLTGWPGRLGPITGETR